MANRSRFRRKLPSNSSCLTKFKKRPGMRRTLRMPLFNLRQHPTARNRKLTSSLSLPGFRNSTSFPTRTLLKLNICVIELAMASKEPCPIRVPSGQLSSSAGAPIFCTRFETPQELHPCEMKTGKNKDEQSIRRNAEESDSRGACQNLGWQNAMMSFTAGPLRRRSRACCPSRR